MRILGVDPGTRCTGYGVVEQSRGGLSAVAYGAIPLDARRSLVERLGLIFDGLREVIDAHRPAVLALEKAFYGRNVQSAMRIGEARAVAMLCAQRAGLTVAEYAPAAIKRSVVGAGRAHKSQVQRMVRIHLGLEEEPRPEDAADALAVAICHAHHAVVEDRIP